MLQPTSSDIEGPFFKEGAPLRSCLYQGSGKPLFLKGRVLDEDGNPIIFGLDKLMFSTLVKLELWHADEQGHYDNNGYNYRAHTLTENNGSFSFFTIFPGCYKLGPDRWRPGHLHFKLEAAGYEDLTTQIYFAGDEHNASDQWYDPAREIDPKQNADGIWVASFNFVLRKIRGTVEEQILKVIGFAPKKPREIVEKLSHIREEQIRSTIRALIEHNKIQPDKNWKLRVIK